VDLRLEISPPELDLAPQMCSRGCGSKVLACGLCRTCYEYQRRTGKPRPEHLIVSHGARIQERLEFRRVLALAARF